jgi:hypothetical protein
MRRYMVGGVNNVTLLGFAPNECAYDTRLTYTGHKTAPALLIFWTYICIWRPNQLHPEYAT